MLASTHLTVLQRSSQPLELVCTRLHGWQVVDELNRAFAGEEHSGYVAPAHLFVPSNIEHDGGPRNIYDPENGYQDAYKQIWGVK